MASTLVFGPLLSACGVIPAIKFDWFATESAPKDYPMEIVRGYFIAPDGYSLYVPKEKTIHPGWGTMISSQVVGPTLKPILSRLGIGFFSYFDKVYCFNRALEGKFGCYKNIALSSHRRSEEQSHSIGSYWLAQSLFGIFSLTIDRKNKKFSTHSYA